MGKPGKIIIKGSGRKIERLETSLDRWKSYMDVTRTQKPVKNSTTSIKRLSLINQPLVSASKKQMLVPDMIRLVLERLNVAEFHIARSISSDWYNITELCIRRNTTPWLILFPNNDSCKLFDPCENKPYTVNDFGVNFHKSRCLANSGSWFLMLDHRINFHLLNLFTRERIRLPSLESIEGCQMEIEMVGESDFLVTFFYEATGNVASGRCNEIKIGSAVLWLDEKSRDYFVVWNIDCFFAYYKNGDSNKSWKVFQPLENQGCIDMVFKESKLYVLSRSRNITVFDFSCSNSPVELASFRFPNLDNKHHFNNLALTLSGDILVIESRVKPPEICYFNVYMINPKSSMWIRIQSLWNEALVFDLGTTVEAKDGVEEHCIYFSNDQVHRCNAIGLCYATSACIYNIRTKKVVRWPQKLAASSLSHFKDTRWFFPTFGSK